MHAALAVSLAVLLQVSPDKATVCKSLAPKIAKALHLDEAVPSEFPADPKALETIQAGIAQRCAARSDAEVKCVADAKADAVLGCEWAMGAATESMSAFERGYQARQLPAAPPAGAAKPERCSAAFESLATALRMKEAAANDPRMGPEFIPGTKALFAEDCAKLADSDIACVFGKGQAELRSCEAAMEAFIGASQRYIQQKDPGAFARFRKASMQTEAKANLKALSTALRFLFEEDPAKFAKLSKLAPTPAGDCCKAPDKKCKVDRAAMAGAWKDLMWSPEDGVRYHYSLARTGKTTIVLRAEGDPACEGKPEAWEVTAIVDGPQLQMDEPHLAR